MARPTPEARLHIWGRQSAQYFARANCCLTVTSSSAIWVASYACSRSYSSAVRAVRQMHVQLRTARELDTHKVRQFETLDAAVRAAGEIGFDVRSIGIARVAQRATPQRGAKTGDRANGHRSMLPDAH